MSSQNLISEHSDLNSVLFQAGCQWKWLSCECDEKRSWQQV